MGANGDAGYQNSSSALDFSLATTAHVGGVQRVGGFAPVRPSSPAALVGFGGNDLSAARCDHPSRIGAFHLKQVDLSELTYGNVEDLPLDPIVSPGASHHPFSPRSLAAEQGHFDS